jgi:siroheme synthase
MGLEAVTEVRDRLLAEGLVPETAAAVISSGTCSDQEVRVATLGELAEVAAGLEPPALLVVGEVVRCRFTANRALATVEA